MPRRLPATVAAVAVGDVADAWRSLPAFVAFGAAIRHPQSGTWHLHRQYWMIRVPGSLASRLIASSRLCCRVHKVVHRSHGAVQSRRVEPHHAADVRAPGILVWLHPKHLSAPLSSESEYSLLL